MKKKTLAIYEDTHATLCLVKINSPGASLADVAETAANLLRESRIAVTPIGTRKPLMASPPHRRR